jgi:hypothetical protein
LTRITKALRVNHIDSAESSQSPLYEGSVIKLTLPQKVSAVAMQRCVPPRRRHPIGYYPLEYLRAALLIAQLNPSTKSPPFRPVKRPKHDDDGSFSLALYWQIRANALG